MFHGMNWSRASVREKCMRDDKLALIGEAGEKLSSMAYNSLREMIVYGQLEPGERLYPSEIAERFGISATPVKEAFTRLHTEGYLEAIPRRGYSVTVPTPKRITELWQVRRGLEITAGELIIQRLLAGALTDADLDVLDRQLELLDKEGSSSHRQHVELNAAFHLSLVQLTGNETLLGVYLSIAQHTVGAWVQTGLSSWKDRLAGEREEHLDIVDALRNRSEDDFRGAMRRHLDRSLSDAMSDVSIRALATEGRES